MFSWNYSRVMYIALSASFFMYSLSLSCGMQLVMSGQCLDM